MGLSQSTVSHAIASLEAELGIILLWRGRQGARLTPAGEQLIAPIRQMLLLLDGVVKEANLQRGLQRGQVRIASFRSVATHLLPEAIAQFRQKCPSIAVTITEFFDYPCIEQALRDGEADIGFTFLPAASDLETWDVLQDEYMVLLPADPYSTAASSELPQMTWDDLENAPLILYPDAFSSFAMVRDYFLEAQRTMTVRYQFRETSTILSMVAQGFGISILPRLCTRHLPQDVRLGLLPTPLSRTIGTAILADVLHPPAVFAFLETLRGGPLFDDVLHDALPDQTNLASR